MAKINLTEISVEQLRTLNECGGFYIAVNSEEKAEELVEKFKLYEYRVEPFHGENIQPLRPGRLYIWIRTRGPMVLYLVQEHTPNMFQQITKTYPKIKVLLRSISLSKQKEELEQIANILDPQKQ